MTSQQRKIIAWLNRAYYAEKKLRALESLRESDRERAQRITAVYGGNNKGKSDSRSNTQEIALITLACSIEKYDRFLAEYNTMRREIESAIDSLHDHELEAIFIYRYLEYRTMSDIAERMHYDERTIKRKHKAGIEKLSPNVTLRHCMSPLDVL